jgi:hypothetical protein
MFLEAAINISLSGAGRLSEGSLLGKSVLGIVVQHV